MICPVCHTEADPEGGICENGYHTVAFECPSVGCRVRRFTYQVAL